MFTMKVKTGMTKWMDGLNVLFRHVKPLRKGQESVPEARPEPRTEGERSLYQAMGWTDNAWREG